MRMEELSKGEVLVSAVASAAHEKWRAWWKVKNSGQEVPRMKETKDSAWIVVHGGNAVDINVPYDQLPADWQLENKTSAQAAVGQIQQVRLEGGGKLDQSVVERIADAVHEIWMQMQRDKGYDPANEKDWGWAKLLMVPYNQLTEEEKQKDREFAILAMEVIGKS